MLAHLPEQVSKELAKPPSPLSADDYTGAFYSSDKKLVPEGKITSFMARYVCLHLTAHPFENTYLLDKGIIFLYGPYGKWHTAHSKKIPLLGGVLERDGHITCFVLFVRRLMYLSPPDFHPLSALLRSEMLKGYVSFMRA